MGLEDLPCVRLWATAAPVPPFLILKRAFARPFPAGLYTDEEYETRRRRYPHAMPFTKESLLYREIFERYYPGQAEMIAGFWMPNRAWQGCDVDDPSARVLANYGGSGE